MTSLQAFVTCSLGIHMIGYVMIVFAVSNSIVSFVSGHIVRYITRVTFIIVG